MSGTDLPKGWELVELGDLRAPGNYMFVGGPFGSDLTRDDYLAEPGVPVIRGTNLGGDSGRFVDEGFVYVSEQKAQALRRNMAFPGDLIFTQRGTLGQVAVIPSRSQFPKYVISQSQMKLTPDPGRVDTRFLYHYFRTDETIARIRSRTQATGVPHINLGILREIPVPVPPLAEQRRIARMLDRADALLAKRRGALRLLDVVTQSIFFDLFGDPGANPRFWPRVKLRELILTGPQNGLYKPSSEYGAGVPIVRIDGFYDGVVTNLTMLKRVRISDGERELYGLRADDILVNRVNSLEYLGKSALIPDLAEPTIFESNMIRFRVDAQRIISQYVVQFLQSAFVKGQILKAAKNAVNQSSINQQDVKALVINVPPVALQCNFARAAAAVEHLKIANRKSLSAMDALLGAIRHRAFLGEL